MRTAILAARHEIAEIAAYNLGLNRTEWIYLDSLEKWTGIDPRQTRLVRAWSPGIAFSEDQLAVHDCWEEMGYTVEVVTT